MNVFGLSAPGVPDHPVGDLTAEETALINLLRGSIWSKDFSVTIRRKDGRFAVMQSLVGATQGVGFGTGDCFEDAWEAAARP